MPELPEALGAALTARYRWGEPKRPITHGQGRTARMNRLEKALGGAAQAAAAAGIPRSTWGHMRRGRAAAPKTLGKLEAAFTRLVMRPAMAAAIAKKGIPKVWAVTAVVVCDPRGTRYINRKVDGPNGPRGGGAEEGWRTFRAEDIDGQAVVNAWLHSGDEGAAAALERAVADQYGEEFGFEGDHVEVAFE